MKIDDFKKCIIDCNDVVFTYNKLSSGITSEVRNSIPIYQCWHGDNVKEYLNVRLLLEDKFFSGKSILELFGKIEMRFV